MSGIDKSKESAKPPPNGIDGNDFLQSLRGSVSDSHYNGAPPQTAAEHLAATVSTPQIFAKPPRSSLGKNQKKVSLQDVLQAEPMENEVDTALVQSLDERSSNSTSSPRPHHRAVATGTSTILSNIPLDETTAHEFEIDQVPPAVLNSYHDDDDESSLDGGVEGSGRPVSQRSVQSRPLLQRNSTMTKSTRPSVHQHQRGQSVEQTLLSLTLALTDMHGKPPKIKLHHHRDASSADEFAANAVRLHSQQNPDESAVEATPGSTSTAAAGAANGRRLWDTLLDSLPTLREQANREATAGSSTSSGTASGDEAQTEVPVAPPPMADTTADLEQGNPTTPGSDKKNSPPGQNDHSLPQTKSGGKQGKALQGNKTKRKKQNGMHASMARQDIMESEGGRRGQRGMDKFKEDWQAWTDFFRPRREQLVIYLKTLILYFVIPLVGIAAILYYFAENPPTGHRDEETSATDTERASASYILLFCCRQLVTFSLAFATQVFIIDFIALNTRIMLNLVGPVLTLLVVQSKGWPFMLLWWSIYDFALLAGDYPFTHHWVYFQSTIGLFSEDNPSGQLVDNEWYWRALTIATSISLVVSVKRFLVGLYLGRATFAHYGKPLAKVMSKMLLVGEVASFAKDVERLAAERGEGTTERLIAQNAAIHGLSFVCSNEDEETVTNMSTKSMDPAKRDPLTGTLQYSERMQIMQLLEQWEEPVQHDNRSRNEAASISAVLRFRRALTFIQKRFPFGKDFGLADTRAACVESTQDLYRRLMLATPGEEYLSFETMAFLALEDDGSINQDKVKAMIKLFRPDRQGNLTLLDFCKSVDAVYKEFRFLGATIENSSQIDRAFENIFNAVFYIIVGCIIMSQLGFDPLSLFLSLSSVILAFAFMIGSASAKYFEGILFILVRRPYGIGDRVQVGNIESNGSLHGALPWCVENVTLFETTLVYLPTNERASLSNGSLANSRIINWGRSPQAQFHIFLQFPLNTPYQKLVLFKRAVEEYMRARPREWRALNGFRCNMVYAKENYMEYIIVIQHREAWQEVGQVLDSKANLTSYCQEVARQLDMEYQAPQVPVHFTQGVPTGLAPSVRSQDQQLRHSATAVDDEQFDENELAHKFADIAHKKHGIRVC